VWKQMSDDDVFRPLLPFTALGSALQYASGALLERGPGMTSLLDTTPRQRTAHQVLETGQLATNIADGVVSATGVTATRMPADSDADVVGAASGRSVLFLDEQSPSDYPGDAARALAVERAPIRAEHVMASSAIPVAFPPVPITEPEPAGMASRDGQLADRPADPRRRGCGRTQELLSYLFFDEEYFEASIELGRRTAVNALTRGWIR
jgi:NTE family protein